MNRGIAYIIMSLLLLQNVVANDSLQFFAPNHPYILYTGRIDFTNPLLPRFWQPGVYFEARFEGSSCEVILNDERLWGSFNNYIEIVVDQKATRMKTKGKTDMIRVSNLDKGYHTLLVCKNTEANIGYLELVGLRCKDLAEQPPKRLRKIEFIGNSITCGAGSDMAEIPCGKGLWQDQHNAYLSYGPITARKLNAQYHLSAVSGIGLMHSCCNMDIIMPQVLDKISMRNDTIPWKFEQYQPQVVTICLGQNDGIQDSATFCDNYIAFLKRLRVYYPKATLVCLGSPMADPALASFMKKALAAIATTLQKEGHQNIHTWFFSKRYHNGCDEHPDLNEHQLMAEELGAYLKKIMNW